MSIVNKPHTFSPSTTASASEVNDDFDTLYNEFNGSISAANLASNAVTTAKITDANVTTAKIADAAVTGDKIDFSTFNHYDEITTAFSTASTSDVAVTGLSLTFTVPTGGASYMLTFSSPSVYNSGSNYNTVRVWDGTIGSGTKVLEAATFGNNGTALPITYSKRLPLTAGSHTLNVSLAASAGTANILADSTARQTSISAVRVI